MLKYELINSDIVNALAYCGHKDKILITSSNYPLETRVNPDAMKVHLGISPMLPTSTDVLKAILTAVPIEAAAVIGKKGKTCEAHDEYREQLGDIELEIIEDPAKYYEMSHENVVRLAISTGDNRVFANVLLTVGCRWFGE